MRRFAPAARRLAVAPNLTPMIDVVFLLIVFFLVSSYLAQREVRLDLALPAASTGDRAEAPAGRWTINLPSEGPPLLGATPIDARQLHQRLEAVTAAGQPAPPVRVRGDRATPFAAIEPLLAACAEAGVTDLCFGVFPDARDRSAE